MLKNLFILKVFSFILSCKFGVCIFELLLVIIFSKGITLQSNCLKTLLIVFVNVSGMRIRQLTKDLAEVAQFTLSGRLV